MSTHRQIYLLLMFSYFQFQQITTYEKDLHSSVLKTYSEDILAKNKVTPYQRLKFFSLAVC